MSEHPRTPEEALEVACRLIQEEHDCPLEPYQWCYVESSIACPRSTDYWRCWRDWLLAGAPGLEEP